MPGEIIGTAATEVAISKGLIPFIERRIWRLRFLPCLLHRRGASLRVSFSAFLRVASGDRYVLVRNNLPPREHYFGPFGGVYKYYSPEAEPKLHDLEFKPQGDPLNTATRDMLHDLRGFIPRRNVLQVLDWYEAGANRESHGDCLTRELGEELREVRLVGRLPLAKQMRFRLIRTISEGPEPVEGHAFTQYRHLEIYDFISSEDQTKTFLDSLMDVAADHPDLLAASAQEIRQGHASDSRLIAHHAGYLLGMTRIRREEPALL